MVRLRTALTLIVTLSALGCGELDDVTGLWRTLDQPLSLIAGTPPGPCLDGTYVQLAVGQYDREVAGVIKFFDSPDFVEERCPCSFLYNGRYKNGTLTFDFSQPGNEGGEDVWLRAVLELYPEEDPYLKGDVFLLGPEDYQHCGALTLDGDPGRELTDELKRCDPSEAGTWAGDQDNSEGGDG